MMNQVTLEGYVCGQVRVSATKSGKQVTSFSLNCPKRRNVDGQWQSQPRYFDCTYWHNEGNDFRAPQIADKAHLVVTGDLDWEQYDYNGQKRSKTSVNVRELLTIKPKDEQGGYRAQQSAPAYEPAPLYDEEIPFD